MLAAFGSLTRLSIARPWPIRLTLLGCAMLAMAGCIKIKQETSVQPDGSGKVEFRYGISERMLQMGQGQDDPFADFEPARLAQQEENGWVAFTQPEQVEEDGYKFITFTGYFEDINVVQFDNDGGDGERIQNTTYAFEQGKLTVDHGVLTQLARSMVESEDMEEPQARAMMEPMLRGMEIMVAYHVPGQVTAAGPLAAEGDSAKGSFTDEHVLAESSDHLRKLSNSPQIEIRYEPSDWDEAQKQAWQAELAQAREAWAQIKADADAEGEGEGETSDSNGE